MSKHPWPNHWAPYCSWCWAILSLSCPIRLDKCADCSDWNRTSTPSSKDHLILPILPDTNWATAAHLSKITPRGFLLVIFTINERIAHFQDFSGMAGAWKKTKLSCKEFLWYNTSDRKSEKVWLHKFHLLLLTEVHLARKPITIHQRSRISANLVTANNQEQCRIACREWPESRVRVQLVQVCRVIVSPLKLLD